MLHTGYTDVLSNIIVKVCIDQYIYNGIFVYIDLLLCDYFYLHKNAAAFRLRYYFCPWPITFIKMTYSTTVAPYF